MLSKEDNDLLCRVGPGTAMGNLLRQYWMPVLYSWELEAPAASRSGAGRRGGRLGDCV